MRNLTTVLFDLGGVLIELGPITRMMSTSPFRSEEILQNWIQSPSVRRFESGRCTPVEFARDVVREYQLTVTADEFLIEFQKWPVGSFPGAMELLDSLKPDYRLACLSNTNQTHWDGFLCDLDIMGCFDRRFLSHETGYLKPDVDAYEHALEELDAQPDEILFFDDNPSNVDTARQLGLHAELVARPEGVIDSLNRLGVPGNR